MGEFRSDCCDPKPDCCCRPQNDCCNDGNSIWGNTYFISCPLFSVLRE